MSTPDRDYVVIVPAGSRVRYVASDYATQVYVTTVESLSPGAITAVWFPQWRVEELSGLPLRDAEPFTDVTSA
jgi:hypothetical protein